MVSYLRRSPPQTGFFSSRWGLKPLGWGLKPLSWGLKPLGWGFKPLGWGLKPLGWGLKPLGWGLKPLGWGLKPLGWGLKPLGWGLKPLSWGFSGLGPVGNGCGQNQLIVHGISQSLDPPNPPLSWGAFEAPLLQAPNFPIGDRPPCFCSRD